MKGGEKNGGFYPHTFQKSDESHITERSERYKD